MKIQDVFKKIIGWENFVWRFKTSSKRKHLKRQRKRQKQHTWMISLPYLNKSYLLLINKST